VVFSLFLPLSSLSGWTDNPLSVGYHTELACVGPNQFCQNTSPPILEFLVFYLF